MPGEFLRGHATNDLDRKYAFRNAIALFVFAKIPVCLASILMTMQNCISYFAILWLIMVF